VKFVEPHKLAEFTFCAGKCLQSDEMKQLKRWKMNGQKLFDKELVRVNLAEQTAADSKMVLSEASIFDCIQNGEVSYSFWEKGAQIEERTDLLEISATDINEYLKTKGFALSTVGEKKEAKRKEKLEQAKADL
jgi:hypothetical protein